MSRFGLTGKLIAQPGKRGELVDHLLEGADLLEEHEACELYAVGITPSEDDAVWITEIWRSQADHDASLALEGVRELIHRARPLMARVAEPITVTVVGGKGLK